MNIPITWLTYVRTGPQKKIRGRIVRVRILSSGGEPERACITDPMFCHGTQI